MVTNQLDRGERHAIQKLRGITPADQRQLADSSAKRLQQLEGVAVRASQRGVVDDRRQGAIEIEAEDYLGERDPC